MSLSAKFGGSLASTGGYTPPTPYNLGTVSGNVDITPAMGELIFCNMTGDVTFIPTGNWGNMPRMAKVRICVEYSSSSAYSVNFGEGVGKLSLDYVDLPFVMQQYKRASFDLTWEAGRWTLEGVTAFAEEGTD